MVLLVGATGCGPQARKVAEPSPVAKPASDGGVAAEQGADDFKTPSGVAGDSPAPEPVRSVEVEADQREIAPVYIPPEAPPVYIPADAPPSYIPADAPPGSTSQGAPAVPITAGIAAAGGGPVSGGADEPVETVIVAVGDEASASRPSISEGSLYLPDGDGGYVSPFPLRKTTVRSRIDGFLARTEVRQLFGNPHRDPIEGVYCFPLPVDAGIHEFEVRIGERRIVGVVRPREEAELLYRAARAEGRVATLLSQERPNVFTQSIANIEPGGTLEVRLAYVHTLSFDRGTFEYLFPMTVGPRHVPGSPFGLPASRRAGGGTSADTDLVPDASRISPPSLPPSSRDAAEVDLEVTIDAGMPIREVVAPTHGVVVERPSSSTARVVLTSKEPVANRDFVLRYRVAPDAIAGAAFLHEGDGGAYAALLVVPPIEAVDADAAPREVLFVVDTSGSMVGVPLQMSREIVRRGVRMLRPGDTFNIVRFAGDASMLAPRPVPADDAGIARADAFLQGLSAIGSSEMLPALEACLATPPGPGASRFVCFLTDGFTGYEGRIFELVSIRGKDARWLALGVGSSVNRYLLGGIAERGHGAVHYALPREGPDAERAVSRFLALIHAPVLADVTLEPGGLPLEDMEPADLPDLFAGQPLTVVARTRGSLDGLVTLRGTANGRSLRIAIPVKAERRGPLPEIEHLWARRRLESLLRKAEIAPPGDDAAWRDAERLALDKELLSPFTSYLAVDDSRIVGDGRPLRILQPLPVPESSSLHATVGDEPVDRPVLLDAWDADIALSHLGEIVVTTARPEGRGSRAGLRPGDAVASVDSVAVNGMRHLEALLLQEQRGGSVEVGVRPSGDPGARVRLLRLPLP